MLLVPTVIASLWFTIFGDSALLRQRNNGDMLVNGAVDTNTSLFRLLDGLPIGAITSVLAVLVIVFFFVTSSDSGSLVIDILSAGGELDPPKLTRVYWAVLEGSRGRFAPDRRCWVTDRVADGRYCHGPAVLNRHGGGVLCDDQSVPLRPGRHT